MKLLNTLILGLLIGTQWVSGQNYSWSSQKSETFLGIQSDGVSEEKAALLGFNNAYGSYVTGIIGNTAAEKAGLKPFDYLYGIDDHRTSERDDLTDLIQKYEPGEQVTLHLIRNGKPISQKITFGKRSDKRDNKRNREEDPYFGVSPDSGCSDDEVGVPVDVSSNSTAAEMGLHDGDLILAINGHPMIDWGDISTAIDAMNIGETITVDYLRNGEQKTGSIPIKSLAETKPLRSSTRYSYKPPHEYAFLGINSDRISREKARKLGFDNPYGHYVTNVIRNTAADRANIQPFDYIYGVDEYRTAKDQDLTTILKKYKPGDQGVIHLIRKSKRQTVPVTLSRRSDARYSDQDKCEEPFFGIRSSHTSRDEDGVTVDIVANSTAQAMGLKDGAVIKSINGHPMYDWTDISTAIDNMKVGQTATVEYSQNGQRKTGSEPIKSYCDTKTKINKSYGNDWSDWMNDDEGISVSPRSPRSPTNRRNLDNVRIKIQDVNPHEAEAMKRQHGVEIPTTNDLRVNNLKLLPNSEEGVFRLTFELPQSGETNIRIFNTAGRQIYNYDLGRFSGDFSDEVNISQNGDGSYFLNIRQGNKTMTQKIDLHNN
ncbi:MAG: hypothetical protein DHS20C18_50530 [Saprospiraceae bacterium]|nr:MAG: hypothetical protein DHS20C18_50530 [Saprospiraceae bacterium]